MNPNRALVERMSTLEVGPAARPGHLMLFPLLDRREGREESSADLQYLLYQQAHRTGLVIIEEIDESGIVGALRVTNQAASAVLLLEGEVLLGMKQTRVLNVSVLVPHQTRLDVPVSCVEAGRWRSVSQRAIGRAGINLAPSVRRAKSASVGRSMRRRLSFASDQGAVWQEVDRVLDAHQVATPTRSYAEIANRRPPKVVNVADRVRPAPNQVGVVACLGSRPVCADVFETPEVLAVVWEGLVASYAADPDDFGRHASAPATTPGPEEIGVWLSAVGGGSITAGPQLGLGEHLTSVAPSVEAAALVFEDRVVHLSVFQADDAQRRSTFAAPSRRRTG